MQAISRCQKIHVIAIGIDELTFVLKTEIDKKMVNFYNLTNLYLPL